MAFSGEPSAVPISVPPGASLVVDYETGTLDSGVSNLKFELPETRSAITVTTDARSGKYGAKSTVGSGPEYVSFGKPRAESFSMDILETRYSEGEDWEYGFSLKIDPA